MRRHLLIVMVFIERTAEKRGILCKKIGKDAYEILGIEDKHIAFSVQMLIMEIPRGN